MSPSRATNHLKGVKKDEQGWLILPTLVGCWRCAEKTEIDEVLSFSLQIDFGIDIGCVYRDMSKPCADGVDVDTGGHWMRGCRVANIMPAQLVPGTS